MSFLNFNKSPVTYGAIMYNGSPGFGTSSCYPFFASHTELAGLKSISSAGLASIINIADVDDYWTVMPGYKILVYADHNYTGTILLTGDNTSGVAPTNYTMSPNNNLASSIQLYFKGNLINDLNFNIIATNYATTYVSYSAYYQKYYRIYEFTDSTGTFYLPPGGRSSVKIAGILIGGGGAGGNTTSSTGGYAGGGGAGGILMTSINVTPGATFNVTIGAGGYQGGAGNPTSITRTYNNVVDASLNVGGGGGGGTAANPTGLVNTIYGYGGGAYGVSTVSRVAGPGYTVTSGSTVFIDNYNFDNNYYVGGRGGTGTTPGGGGGGGADQTGRDALVSTGGNGGRGRTFDSYGQSFTLTGTRYFAGGGGGGLNGTGGLGGGGSYSSNGTGNASSGTANTGGGGGATLSSTGYSVNPNIGMGGSGICIVYFPL